LFQLRVDAVADRAAGAGEELDVAAAHGFSVSVEENCHRKL
jgi:hypothetical protein